MEKQVLKVQSLAWKHRLATAKLDEMSRTKYGKNNYGANDCDELIDALDYGISETDFTEFDKIMKKINEGE